MRPNIVFSLLKSEVKTKLKGVSSKGWLSQKGSFPLLKAGFSAWLKAVVLDEVKEELLLVEVVFSFQFAK